MRGAVVSEANVCSFCGKTRREVRVLIKGLHALICDGCVARADSGAAELAHCASCAVFNGQHAESCPEREIA